MGRQFWREVTRAYPKGPILTATEQDDVVVLRCEIYLPVLARPDVAAVAEIALPLRLYQRLTQHELDGYKWTVKAQAIQEYQNACVLMSAGDE